MTSPAGMSAMSFMLPHVRHGSDFCKRCGQFAQLITICRFCGQNEWRLLCLLTFRLRYFVGVRLGSGAMTQDVESSAPQARIGGVEASQMGWTDERVELLKKLWLDGLS